MAKSRPPKKRRTEDADIPDPARIRSGEIPWNFEDLGAVMTYIADLYHTPKDDWNRKRKGVSFAEPDGSVTRLEFNPDMPLNQVMLWLTDRLRSRGVSQEETMSHMWRFMEIQAFMTDHAPRLRETGLIRDDPDDPAGASISGALLKVLASARYEGVRLGGPDGDPEPTFHPERVIAEALASEDLENE